MHRRQPQGSVPSLRRWSASEWRATDGGSIINVSSTGAVRPTADIVPYAAAKAGVNAMTVGLADALGRRCGSTRSCPGRSSRASRGTGTWSVLAERAETFPLRRAGEAGEIVGAALYFASRSVVVHDRDDPHGRRRRAMEHAGRGRSAEHEQSARRDLAAPLWLRAVHRLERAIGEPIESALHSDTYFDLVTDDAARRARTGRTLEDALPAVLHLLNLPASSDVKPPPRAARPRGEASSPPVSKEVEGHDGRAEDTTHSRDE